MVWKTYQNHVIILRHIQHLQVWNNGFEIFFSFNKVTINVHISGIIFYYNNLYWKRNNLIYSLKLETLLYQNINILFHLILYSQSDFDSKKKWSNRKKKHANYIIWLFLVLQFLIYIYRYLLLCKYHYEYQIVFWQWFHSVIKWWIHSRFDFLEISSYLKF